MNVKTLQRSFAAGIIGPELYGRIDLVKQQTGLAQCVNFRTLPHGPAENRPGFKYVLETKDSTKASRLLPFAFNSEQTMALECGDQYLRFHTNGATLLETAKNITGITQANPGVVTSNAHGFSNGQWGYLAAIGGMTQLNGRFVKFANVTANTFTMTDLAGTAINTTTYGAYTAGGTVSRVYEVSTPYLEADLFNLHYVQSEDVLTLVSPNYAPRELRRAAATTWTLTSITFAPSVAAPATVLAQEFPSGSFSSTAPAHVYKVTAVADDGVEESIGSIRSFSAGGRVIASITNANPGLFTTVAAAHDLVVDDLVRIAGATGMTQINGEDYHVSTVPAANTFTLKNANTGVPIDTTAFGVYGASSGGVYLRGVKVDLTTVGNKVRVTWSAAVGALRYNIYKLYNGVYGYVGQVEATQTYFNDDNITPNISRTPPAEDNPFDSADNYPAAVNYHEQRRCFAGTNNQPANFWATRSGTESNFSYSIPTVDSDTVQFKVKAQKANTVRHIVSLKDLVLLTADIANNVQPVVTGSGVFRIAPQNSDVLTPSSASVKSEAAASIIFANARGGRLSEIKWSWEKDGLEPRDICVLAPHLFDDYTIVDLAYVQTPHKFVYAVRSDGKLLGLTYLPEHDVTAWHEHNTSGGSFKSITAVAEGNEDALYAIVARTINGRAVRYIERQQSRAFTDLADAFFVDCGLTYSGASTTTISNLWHLEGEEVTILLNGATHANKTVTNGSITLDEAGTKAQIGKGITADLQTLPLSFETQAGGIGTHKNVSQVYLRLYRSSDIWAGPTFDKLKQYAQRTNEPYGSPPSLITGVIPLKQTPTWTEDAQVCVRQTSPLPITVAALGIETKLAA